MCSDEQVVWCSREVTLCNTEIHQHLELVTEQLVTGAGRVPAAPRESDA